ncbi:MAG TPA: FAD-dependent monooxygenase [Gaiellaceae bacterium]|nr:FAD-dependent monooxygenase [Gaiellaceae bacterium]
MADDLPVLIVGGSLVGLSAAVFLGARGVPSLVVERHVGTAIHPRAALVNQRTMETYRAVGIEAAIEEAAGREFVQNGAIVSVESLGGKELDWYFREINEGVEDLSPSARIFITQIGLEPILLAKAKEVGAEVRYSAEVVGLDQDDDGVTARIRPRDGGEEQTVRAQYVVAADGAHSPVRQRLGVAMLGHGSFSDSITIYFRADVRELLGDRNLSVIYVFHPRLVGFFRFSIDADAGFLVVNATIDEEGNRSTAIGEDMSEETCIGYVRLALGAPGLPVQIENVQRWSATADWAERFSEGRVLIAGDAAHVMPPTGGFGGNTGVQDAYDLAWKLQYVLQGLASPALLETYDDERRPVGEFATEQAYTRYVLRLDPGLGKENLQPIVREDAVELGYRYSSGAIEAEADDDGLVWEDPHAPTARPGTRAPHLELERDGSSVSSLDLFGRDFVLLAAAEGQAWCEAAASAAKELGVSVEAYRDGADFGSDRFAELYGVGSAGAVLVRPDGFVAWRAREEAGDVAGALRRALLR